VPGDEAGAVGFFDEKVGRPTQKVWTEHVFSRIEDPGMMHKFVNPSEQEMGLVTKIPLERTTNFGLVLFETFASVRDLSG
jgi:hypothetical protein